MTGIMGNQRQIVKEMIKKELGSSFKDADNTVVKINKNLEACREKATRIKDEITEAADLLTKILIQRKNQLLREVDNLHETQVRVLQMGIEHAYLTMGKIQTMENHIDTFDQSKLVNIQIPKVEMSFMFPEQCPIYSNLTTGPLQEQLKEWGCVSIQEFDYNLPPQPTPASSAENTGILPQIQRQAETEPSSQNAPNLLTANPDAMQSSWTLENWLSKPIPKSHVSEDDGFVIIRPQSPAPSSSCISDAEDDENMAFVLPNDQVDTNETGSSIFCIGRGSSVNDNNSDDQLSQSSVPESVENEDLSKWLKPKKNPMAEVTPVPVLLPYNGPAHHRVISDQVSDVNENNDKLPIIQVTPLIAETNDPSTNKKRILHFPCLEMDAENWLRKKKTDTQCRISPYITMYERTHHELLRQTQTPPLLSPMYSLPNPFWLKSRKF